MSRPVLSSRWSTSATCARPSSTAATPRETSGRRARVGWPPGSAGPFPGTARARRCAPASAPRDMATSVLPWLGTTEVNRHTRVSRADCCSKIALRSERMLSMIQPRIADLHHARLARIHCGSAGSPPARRMPHGVGERIEARRRRPQQRAPAARRATPPSAEAIEARPPGTAGCAGYEDARGGTARDTIAAVGCGISLFGELRLVAIEHGLEHRALDLRLGAPAPAAPRRPCPALSLLRGLRVHRGARVRCTWR